MIVLTSFVQWLKGIYRCRFHTGEFQFDLGWRFVIHLRRKLLLKIVKITKYYIFFQFGEFHLDGARFSHAIPSQKRKVKNLSDLKGEYVEFYRKSYLYNHDFEPNGNYLFYIRHGASMNELRGPYLDDEPVVTGNDPKPDFKLGEPRACLVYKVRKMQVI